MFALSVRPELTIDDERHITAAEGWLELGSWKDANEELEAISFDCRVHPKVLTLRWYVYAAAKKWDYALEIARLFAKHAPEEAQGWIHVSIALHGLKRTQEAFDSLAGIEGRFPNIWAIPYNLACYCAQLGKLKEAEDWFTRAISINAVEVRAVALKDPDLKPLWDSFGGSFCR